MNTPEAAEPRLIESRRGPDLTARELHDLLALREGVFVVEQDCPYHEIDGQDLSPTTLHLWITDSLGVASTVRLLNLDTASPARIGRVATRPDSRGQRLSSRLMEEALAAVGSSEAVLDAQTYLVEFYRRFGFDQDGDDFVEDAIPHTPMRRPGNPQ